MRMARICKHCGGSGEATCPCCGGTRKFDNGERCYYCGGKGVVECRACDGTGLIED